MFSLGCDLSMSSCLCPFLFTSAEAPQSKEQVPGFVSGLSAVQASAEAPVKRWSKRR